MPGTALWVDGFICLPLSPSLHLSPSLDALPGCLARRSGWTDSVVSLCFPLFGPGWLPAWMARLSAWTDSFVSTVSQLGRAQLSPFVSSPSCCLPAWMRGTALWVDGFICLPLSRVFEAQKRVSERARALDQATGSMLRMNPRLL